MSSIVRAAVGASLALAASAQGQTYLDFDNNGFADLVIGCPGEGEDAGVRTSAGGLAELAGTSSGLSSSDSALWTQNSSGVLDTCESGDQFGGALATGDFNGDGRADLAIGVITEKVGTKTGAGAVSVLYGSSSGLSSTNDQFVHQDTSGIAETARTGDQFGYALAAGDFDGDGFDDLAIGIPFKDVSSQADAGAVHIIYGSASGLTTSGDVFVTQNTSGVTDTAEAGDRFGAALAIGDFDGDGFDDLAVGVPGEDEGGIADCGAVAILKGTSSGLTALNDLFYTQETSGINDSIEAGDQFGFALSSGDYNGDGNADLAIGIPYEDLGSAVDAGAVAVLSGSSTGLSTTNDQLWSQDTSNVNGTAATGDAFGFSVASGNFDGDLYVDLAIGAPFDDAGSTVDSGAVNVLYGTSSGLSATNDEDFSQSGTGVTDDPEDGDHFAFALSAADFDGDGNDDLAVGVPGEDYASGVDAGAVNVLYGSAGGVTDEGDEFWTQNTGSIPGTSGDGDRFGEALPKR